MDSKRLEAIGGQIGISLIPCQSSNLVAFGYDIKYSCLWVLFKNNKLYRYPWRTYEEFLDLLQADSKGKWLNQHLVSKEAKCKAYSVE